MIPILAFVNKALNKTALPKYVIQKIQSQNQRKRNEESSRNYEHMSISMKEMTVK